MNNLQATGRGHPKISHGFDNVGLFRLRAMHLHWIVTPRSEHGPFSKSLRGRFHMTFLCEIASSNAEGKFLVGQRGDVEPFFPNLILRQRDKAHGVQRVIGRAWLNDPYLKNIIGKLVLDSGALAQRIRFSPVFRSRYQKYVAELTGNQKSRIKDLSSAKHRFSSHTAPLSRACLYFIPLLRCAQSILDERGARSEEGRDAHAWLSMVDEESALQLGMMADCSSESLALIRFFDTDNYDKGEITAELGMFLKRVTWLFEQQGCLTTGYTAHMIETLRVRRLIFIDGKPKAFGGEGALRRQCVQACLQRMLNWLQLCRHTVRAELPEFESLQAFTCFLLSGNATPQTYASLQKVAGMLKLDARGLRAQFDIRPLAQHHLTMGLPQPLAWQAAVQCATRSSKSVSAHPVDILTSALARYIAWNASTMGVERMFGKLVCGSTAARGDISEARIDDEARGRGLVGDTSRAGKIPMVRRPHA